MDFFTRLASLNGVAEWANVVVTFLGILFAGLGVWWQLRKQWLLHSAALMASLDERFQSPEFRCQRANGALRINEHVKEQKQLDLSDDLPVLGFFENVAYLVKRGALDKKMVWNKFGWYVVGYYLAITRWKNENGKNAIEQYREQESDETNYEEFVWLYVECLEIYRKSGAQVYNCCWQKKKIENLLKNELVLCSHARKPGV